MFMTVQALACCRCCGGCLGDGRMMILGDLLSRGEAAIFEAIERKEQESLTLDFTGVGAASPTPSS